MLYLTITHTREHIMVSEPKVAKALTDTVVGIKMMEEQGRVLVSGIIGPFTPLHMFALHECDSHEDIFEQMTGLPGSPYCQIEIYPVIDLSYVQDYLKQHITKKV